MSQTPILKFLLLVSRWEHAFHGLDMTDKQKKTKRGGERQSLQSQVTSKLKLIKGEDHTIQRYFLDVLTPCPFYFKFCLKFLLFTPSPLSCRVESSLPEYRRVLSSALLHVYNRIAGFTSIAVNVAINKFLRKQNVFTWWAPVTQYREREGRGGAADEIVLPETHCRTLASVVKPRLGQYTLCCCCCFSFQGRNRKYIPE